MFLTNAAAALHHNQVQTPHGHPNPSQRAHKCPAAAEEWTKLSERFPADVKVATRLPIPSYHGLFVGDALDVIMSDCGPSPRSKTSTASSREAHGRASAALEQVGIQAQDVAPRNAVYDGESVRVVIE
ncbi:hypothetical protein BV20DRAFT_1057134 [Pilatotrama ljubarskyi]|nr:hypothetical protein BV20DRAFT_1057134 [Pilatotrama ljubarskyi]